MTRYKPNRFSFIVPSIRGFACRGTLKMDLDSPVPAVTISGNENRSFVVDLRSGDRVFLDPGARPSLAFGIL